MALRSARPIKPPEPTAKGANACKDEGLVPFDAIYSLKSGAQYYRDGDRFWVGNTKICAVHSTDADRDNGLLATFTCDSTLSSYQRTSDRPLQGRTYSDRYILINDKRFKLLCVCDEKRGKNSFIWAREADVELIQTIKRK